MLGGRENLDAVSFLQEVNATCYKRSAGIVMIAEESTAWPGVTRPVHLGGLGFGLKWNMGWMHDTLSYLAHDPVYRRYHHNELTFSMMYAYSENFALPLSHDEVVHGKGSLIGKMPGDDWKRFATLRALFGYMWAHPGKQLVFMGSEFGQRGEWSQERGLDWDALKGPAHAGLQRLVSDLNAAYRQLPPLWQEDFSPAGFSWIDANDAFGNVISFLRFAEGAPAVACIVNFSGEPHFDYRVGLPSGRALARGRELRRDRLRRQRRRQHGPGRRPRTCPGTAGQRPPCSPSRRLPSSGSSTTHSPRPRRHPATPPAERAARSRPRS